MVRPAVIADAATPMNFTFSCADGVEPIQYPAFRSVMNCPETQSATQTMPARAITKNMPVVPDKPNFSSTTAETITVSRVIPEAGLFAVAAIALAATVVKKNEKSRVSASPTASTLQLTCNCPKKTATAIALTTT